MKPEEVLDQNLRALLSRAYVPVRPSGAFRARLLRELAPRPRVQASRFAAAALLLAVLGLALWLARPSVPAEPCSMLRVDGQAWRPLSEGERQRGVPFEGGALEIQVVRGRHETLRLGAHGSIALDQSAEAGLQGSASEPRIELAAGRARLERLEAGPAWKISAGGASFELCSGSLRLEQRAPELLVFLESGLATRLPAHDPLPVRRELVFRDGAQVETAAALESLPAGIARTPFATDASAPAEPAPAPGAPGLRFSGRLLGPDGAPWSGEFTLVALREERLPEVARPLSRSFHDAQGAFEFALARPGRYTLFALAQGTATLHRPGLEPAAEPSALELRLEAGVTLHGRVLDAATGAALAGATVVSEDDAPTQILPFEQAELPPELAARTRTDEQGQFVLERLSSGLHTLRATAPGHGAGWTPRIDTRSGPATLELRLGPGGAIEAQVEPPRAGLPLVASAIDYSFQRPCLSFALTETDALGHARFEHLPPGPFVVLRADAQAQNDVSFAFVRESETCEVHLGPIPTDHSLDGRLVDGEGAPVAGADLMLQSADGQDETWLTRRTDAGGHFHFDGVRSGSYSLFVGDLGRNFVEVDRPEVGTLDVVREIVLPRGEIAGRVRVAASGGELAQAWLVLQREVAGSWRFAGKTQADAHGRWRFEYLAPGTWRVIAYAQNEKLAPTPSPALELHAGGAALETEIALGSGAALLVSVLDARGEPCAGACIEMRDAQEQLWQFTAADITDLSGRFAVPGMPPGTWVARVVKGGRILAERTIQLEADQSSTLEIHLAPR